MKSNNSIDLVKRLVNVAIVGAPNAGKSTLINKILGVDINAVSKRVHTTRRNCLGVLTRNDTQIRFMDSPGIVTKGHCYKHHLESSLHEGPRQACEVSDVIAVMINASNIREQKRLNRGILELLRATADHTKSILIMNKVDLVKDKGKLIDIGVRLTQGCLDGKLTWDIRDIQRLPTSRVMELNLMSHLPERKSMSESPALAKRKSKYVIDLDRVKNIDGQNLDDEVTSEVSISPDDIGYKYFHQVHSICALTGLGTDKLVDSLAELAYPVDEWPHGPDFVSPQKSGQIVNEIIRGKVLDYVEREVPYQLDYDYLTCGYDELGSLNVNLRLRCPKSYMIAMVLGKGGSTIGRIVDESRDMIARNLGCDVKLNIEVMGPKNAGDRLSGQRVSRRI